MFKLDRVLKLCDAHARAVNMLRIGVRHSYRDIRQLQTGRVILLTRNNCINIGVLYEAFIVKTLTWL